MKDKVAEANSKKYLKAPTVKEISDFINELGVTDAQFERFYKISSRMMAKVRNGTRPFPAKYWHIVYEKVIPMYGLSESQLVDNRVYIGPINKPKKVIDKINKSEISQTGERRLDKLKNRLS